MRLIILSIVFCVLSPYTLYSNSFCEEHVSFINSLYQQYVSIIESDETQNKKLELIKKVVSENIDSVYVTPFVLHEYWNSASNKEKADFINEYNSYIVQSYGNLIQKYFGKMEIISTRAVKKLQCITNARILYGDNQIYISYFTIKRGKIFQLYDIALEGVRNSITHRDEFRSVLPKVGINGLIKKLKEEKSR